MSGITDQALHDLLSKGASRFGDAIAIAHGDLTLSYREFDYQVRCLSTVLADLIQPRDRVAIYLPKTLEACIATFAISAVGAVIVPINPVLKPAQVGHILNDSGASLLISQSPRLKSLSSEASLLEIPLISIDDQPSHLNVLRWSELMAEAEASEAGPNIGSTSLAALLYTSGSTGMPKGVMLSHQNLLVGVDSVSQYLSLTADDVILAALPFSFDYGFNQLLTALSVGARCVLLDYLFPKDIINACQRFAVTGLAGVPPLWSQLANQIWPDEVQQQLRYVTNSGGHLSQTLIDRLRTALPKTDVVPMYGLTEAFRSSYLPFNEVAEKPDSMGRAIPNAQLYVINDQQQLCKPFEKGELVHAGPLVALGYWQDQKKTAERFKALPAHIDQKQSIAVWSGDTVYQDKDDYLYFSGRKDNQIKVSGYRISPEEIESVLSLHPAVDQVAVMGVFDDAGIQQIAVAIASQDQDFSEKDCLLYCRQRLAAYMLPSNILIAAQLPTNPNGKLNRSAILALF